MKEVIVNLQLGIRFETDDDTDVEQLMFDMDYSVDIPKVDGVAIKLLDWNIEQHPCVNL